LRQPLRPSGQHALRLARTHHHGKLHGGRKTPGARPLCGEQAASPPPTSVQPTSKSRIFRARLRHYRIPALAGWRRRPDPGRRMSTRPRHGRPGLGTSRKSRSTRCVAATHTSSPRALDDEMEAARRPAPPLSIAPEDGKPDRHRSLVGAGVILLAIAVGSAGSARRDAENAPPCLAPRSSLASTCGYPTTRSSGVEIRRSGHGVNRSDANACIIRYQNSSAS